MFTKDSDGIMWSNRQNFKFGMDTSCTIYSKWTKNCAVCLLWNFQKITYLYESDGVVLVPLYLSIMAGKSLLPDVCIYWYARNDMYLILQVFAAYKLANESHIWHSLDPGISWKFHGDNYISSHITHTCFTWYYIHLLCSFQFTSNLSWKSYRAIS